MRETIILEHCFWVGPSVYSKTHRLLIKNNNVINECLGVWRHYIYLLLVKTKGVAPGKLRTLASVCSFPSLVGSSELPEPEKGQNPLDLEPLPPIFSCSTLFSRVPRLPVVLQCYCTRWNVPSGCDTCEKWQIKGSFSCFQAKHNGTYLFI